MSRYSSYQSPPSSDQLDTDIHIDDNFNMNTSSSAAGVSANRFQKVAAISLTALVVVFLLTMGVSVSLSSSSSSTSFTSFSLSEQKNAHNNNNNKQNDRSVCEDPSYSKTTLKLADERSAIALFRDKKGQRKFEASGIIKVGQYFYIAFDNLWSLGRVAENLPFFSAENILIGPPGVDSGFESLLYDDQTETFFIIIETRPHIHQKRVEFNSNNTGKAVDGPLTVTGREDEFQDVDEDDPNGPTYHAVIQEVRLRTMQSTESPDYEVIRSCDSEKKFSSGNKGMEGAAHVYKDGKFYILGLCEGNFCAGGRRGKTAGNGRLIVMTADYDAKDTPNGCLWRTEHEIHLPSEIAFVDYSAVTLRKTDNSSIFRMAVATQEGAQVWIGTINIDNWHISEGQLYNFPRNDNCEIVFCNIEGLHWLTDEMFVAVSDKMKAKGKQPFVCLQHDQSVHTFVLP